MFVKSEFFNLFLIFVITGILSGTSFFMSQLNMGIFFVLNIFSVSLMSMIVFYYLRDYILFEITEVESV